MSVLILVAGEIKDKRSFKYSLYEIQHDSLRHHVNHSSPCNVKVGVDEQFCGFRKHRLAADTMYTY